MTDHIHTEKQTRRRFLKRAWEILGLVGAFELGLLSLSFFGPVKRKARTDSATLLSAGRVKDIPSGSVLPFRNGKFYLVRLDDGGFLALSLTCSHLGCSVLWNKEEDRFVCPCHSSLFDIRGNVLGRPAPRPLDYYRIVIDEGIVMVDTSTPIRRKGFDKSQLTYA